MMKIIANVIFLLSALLAGFAQATTDTYLASGNWTAPAGVTSVTVEAWGGGGAGGGATGNPAKGGGGAGGQYASKVITVTPGNTYAIGVGAGGAGSTGNGTAGGDSSFATNVVVAKGGAGGSVATVTNGTAGLGSAASGVGTTIFAGGNGSDGAGAAGTGGAGGGGAGSGGAGGSASGNTAGTGTATGGGAGAAARTTGGACANAATVAGGGGCGGYATSSTDRSGGSGAAGMVTISYSSAPTVTTNAATSLTSIGATLNGTASSNGASTAVTFDYGLTASYGSTITASGSPLASGATNTAVSAAVSGLSPSTTYHFRVNGVNSLGTTNGSDLTFTTLPPPTVSSINTASFNPTASNTSVTWTVVFSTSMTGVDTGDFVLAQAGGATGAYITSVGGSGTTWTVTANTGSGTAGTLGLNLVDNDTIVAGAVQLGGAGLGNGNFNGQSYTLLAPVCTGAANEIFCDDFERSSPGTLGNGWTVTPANVTNCTGAAGNTGCSGIDSDIPPFSTYANPRANPTRSMFTRWSIVSVDSPVINLAGRPAAILTFWMRRGSDTFSECPEAAGENYLVEYWDGAAWQILAQYPSSPSAALCGAGQVWTPTIQLPPSALHAGFKLRFYQPSGSGKSGSGGAPGVVGYDYWHMDNVVITEAPASSYTGAFCDNFEGGLGRWSFTAEGGPANLGLVGGAAVGDASLGTTDFNSTSHELDTRWGYVVASTLRTDMTGIGGNISYWLKSGGGTTNRAPDAGENLVAEYFNSAGTWTTLATYLANGSTTSTIYNASFPLPADAKHTGFRLRFRQLAGSGYDMDYWHLDDVCVGSGIPTADLAITKTRSGPLVRGANAPYTLTVTNIGPGTLAGSLSVTDTLPAGLSYFSATGTGWSCSASGQVVTCGWVGTLVSGASASALTLAATVAANASGTITNTATVTGTVVDNVPANNSASDSYTFPVSDISMTMSSPTLTPGANAIYTLNVSNGGPSNDLGPITVVDTLPTGLSYVSGIGTNWSCGAFGQLVTCTLTGTPALANGATSVLTLTTAVASIAAGTITNSATVTGASIDNTLANNTASASYTINATLIAEYHLDETSWNGTAGEVTDTAGYSGGPFNGAAIGSANPTHAIASPAISGNPGTCGYATLPGPIGNGGAFSISGLPVSATSAAKTSVSFWMYWDGTDSVMPLGWNLHSLWLVNGYFGFHTANGDVYGASSTGLSNGWHHVVAVFTNGSVASNQLYIDGVIQTLAQSQGTPTLANAVVSATLKVGGWAADSGHRFSGRMDEVRVYKGVLSQTDVTALLGAGHICTVAVNHYELSLPTSGITCLPTTVTVTACADSSSPCSNSSSAVSGQTAALSTTGGTLGATTVTFGAAGVASTTLSYPAASDGVSATVTLYGETTAATNPRQCCPDGASCAVADSCSSTFNTAGFIFSNAVGGGICDLILNPGACISTQVAGTSSGNYYLRAVKTVDNSGHTCGAAFSGTQPVNLGYECNDPSTCYSSNLMSVNGGAATTIARNDNGSIPGLFASYTAVNMNFDASGNALFTFIYSDVGRVKFWANATVNSADLTGSSNAFVVKPAGFVLSGIQQTTAPNLANPAAADAAGARFVRAGENFSVTVTAVNALGNATPNYGKEAAPEGARLTSALVAPAGGAPGALTGTFGAFNNGVATADGVTLLPDGVTASTPFSWDEVGIITLVPGVGDSNYLGQLDTQCDPALPGYGGATACPPSGNVGRFFPDHFAISGNSIINRADICPGPLGCPAFTYMGEQMNTVFTLTAQTTGAAPTTTSNYAGAFAYLAPDIFANLNMGAVDRATNPAAHALLTPRISVIGMPAITCSTAPCFLAGQATVTAPFTLTRPAAPDGEFTTVDVGIGPADTDNVTVPFDIDITSPAAPLAFDRGRVGTTDMVFGRLKLSNAHGSELLPLPITATAQFWNGATYVTNTLDSLTSFTAFADPDLTLSNLQKLAANPAVIGAAPLTLVNGVGTFTFNRTNASGSVDFAISAASALNNYLPSNTGRATFGVYKGNNDFIYLRENY
jgi:MSHA biogenesis protein MshQ